MNWTVKTCCPASVAKSRRSLNRLELRRLHPDERWTTSMSKTWGGRFSGETDNRVEAFTESISVDQRLYRPDILASQAHARMLAEVGLLKTDESDRIVSTLNDIAGEIERGVFPFTT